MSKKLYEESNIQAIADAIRTKAGTQDTYKTSQMPNAILAINPEPDLETLSVSQNGNYLPSSGKDGFSRVIVNVPSGGSSAILVQKTITANGTYNALLDDNADGYSEVSVAVDSGGTASFDNILVGSTNPDASIGTPGDMYIKTYVNRVDNRAYHIFSKVFYKSSQNIWSDSPDTVLPYSMTSVRIKTHSNSGDDASIDVYINGTLYTNILYTTVLNTNAHYFEDIYGLFIGYNPYGTVTPDGQGRSGWAIFPPQDSMVLYLNNWITSPNVIDSWGYNIHKDLEINIPI